MQQATFVNWVNDRLKVGGKATKVGDLTVDLQDGTVLVRLMEGLTGNKVKGYNRTPRLTAHKMDNLDLVFSFMRSSGIKVVGIGEIIIIVIPPSTQSCIINFIATCIHDVSLDHNNYSRR